MNFLEFKQAVAHAFARMAKHPLYVTTAEKDALWDVYLNSFPPGTNPMYRKRTEYDCSCCKQFIRAVGRIVAVIDNKLVSIWDIDRPCDPAFKTVADAMSAFVKSHPIDNLFLHTEKTAGVDKNFEELVDGSSKKWDHFFVNIPLNFVKKGADIGPHLSGTRATHDVMLRSLTEITDDAIDTVLELMAQNSLYRGEEHKFAVDAFKKLKREFDKVPADAKDFFVWSKVGVVPESVSRIRGTVIGTLLSDLSEGYDLEDCVKSFESKVAPANYKRPTALVTKSMIEAAKKKIEELGLTSALQRRHATLADITINNIIFADRTAKNIIENNVFDDIAATVAEKPKNLSKVEEVSIEKFLSDIVPHSKTIEVMVENKHVGNFVSLIAPVDPTSNIMFKWPNRFSWSYSGDMADSIKERVKKAGGSVVGDLCCRLAWSNFDDLDFHMKEPGSHEIYYGNRGRISPCGGNLDVDMNAGSGTTRTPVENIFYANKSKMKEGIYTLSVHQFALREKTNVGFEVEIDFMGTVYSFNYEKAVRQGEHIIVAQFKYSHKDGITMLQSLPYSQAAKNVWNVSTQNFQKVNVLMMSPNHWDGNGVGNKHYFFMLDKCQNEGNARGFFNEFLKEELTPHRKVIEIVGSKMRTAETEDQLSGLGFSSTQRNDLLVRVTGTFTRTVKVVF